MKWPSIQRDSEILRLYIARKQRAALVKRCAWTWKKAA